MIEDYPDIDKEYKGIEKSSENQIKIIQNSFDLIDAFHS